MRASLTQFPVARLIEMTQARGARISQRRRCRSATTATVAGRLCRAAVGDDRHAARHGASQHAARRVGDGEPRRHPARPHARARSRRLDRGFGEVNGQAFSFYPRTPSARRRAAEQLAGRAWPVDSGDRDEDTAGTAARRHRAVDAVPVDTGDDESRRARRRVQLFPERSRRRRRDRPADAAAACSSATWRRSGRSPAIRASSCTAPATAKSLFGADRAGDWRDHLDLIAGRWRRTAAAPA